MIKLPPNLIFYVLLSCMLVNGVYADSLQATLVPTTFTIYNCQSGQGTLSVSNPWALSLMDVTVSGKYLFSLSGGEHSYIYQVNAPAAGSGTGVLAKDLTIIGTAASGTFDYGKSLSKIIQVIINYAPSPAEQNTNSTIQKASNAVKTAYSELNSNSYQYNGHACNLAEAVKNYGSSTTSLSMAESAYTACNFVNADTYASNAISQAEYATQQAQYVGSVCKNSISSITQAEYAISNANNQIFSGKSCNADISDAVNYVNQATQHLTSARTAFSSDNYGLAASEAGTTISLATQATNVISVCKCSDNTAYNSCSSTKPKFCSNGELIDTCSACGCSAGYDCNQNGMCSVTPPSTASNLQNNPSVPSTSQSPTTQSDTSSTGQSTGGCLGTILLIVLLSIAVIFTSKKQK